MSIPKKYLFEILLFSTYALFAMLWEAGNFLISSHGFTSSQIALETNIISAAKIIGCISTAALIARFGIKNLYSLAILLLISEILLPLTTNFGSILFLRFILGLGGALVLVSINPIVSQIFAKNELTTINGINSVAFNVGLSIVLGLAAPIRANPNITMNIISIALIIILVSWGGISKSLKPHNSNNELAAEKDYGIRQGIKEKFNWIFSLSYAGLLSFYLVSFTFLKPENVKYITYAGIVGAIVGAVWCKKFNNQLKFIRICALIQFLSAALFLLYYNNETVKLLGLITGFFTYLPGAAFITLAYRRPNITPAKISVTFSIFGSVSYFVSIIIVQIFGWLRDISTGNLIPFLFILSAAALFSVGTNFFLKENGDTEYPMY